MVKVNIIIACFLFFNSIRAQTWTENQLVREFSEKIVYDLDFVNDSIFILSNYGLSIVNDDLITSYWLDENSRGPLSDFSLNKSPNKPKFDFIFSSIIFKNEIIWMYSRDYKTVLKIENGQIENYKFEFVSDKSIYPISVSADDRTLWLFFEYYDPLVNEFLKKIYCLRNGIFSILQTETFINTKSLEFFFINDKYKYFISQETSNDNTGNYFVSYSNKDSLIYIIFKNKSRQLLNYYYNHDYTYILTGNYDLIRLSMHNNEVAQMNIAINVSKNDSINLQYDFLIHDNKLYLTKSAGLCVYDIHDFTEKTLTPENYSHNCFTGFDKIKLKNPNQLWLIYGIGLKNNCMYNRFGFSIYNITE